MVKGKIKECQSPEWLPACHPLPAWPALQLQPSSGLPLVWGQQTGPLARLPLPWTTLWWDLCTQYTWLLTSAVKLAARLMIWVPYSGLLMARKVWRQSACRQYVKGPLVIGHEPVQQERGPAADGIKAAALTACLGLAGAASS